MNNPSLSKKAQNLSEVTVDDIPEAIRDTPIGEPASSRSQRKGLFWRLLGLGILAFFATLWMNYQFGVFSARTPSLTNSAAPTVQASSSATPSTTPNAASTPSPTPTTDTLLGHLPYEEALPAELQSLTSDGSLKLRKAAAEAFLAMKEDARAAGIHFYVISAFRSTTDQDVLFFDVKAQRGEVATKRAEVSAPPGYSEHHTGYAIDIGDEDFPDTELQVSFEKTPAFQWLKANAAYYSFELSFPKNNPQGVSYEPWHWRFVGDRHSLETFYKARSLSKTASDPK